MYLRHGHQTLLIAGDITPKAMSAILSGDPGLEKRYTWFGGAPIGMPPDTHRRTTVQPGLAELLLDRGLTILVAPHHGLESGFSADLFRYVSQGKPTLNVISERRHFADEDGTVDARYQSEQGALGTLVDTEGNLEKRFSVSTKDGHHILIVFQGTIPRPRVYLRRTPEELLGIT